jgi:hypothetical protein
VAVGYNVEQWLVMGGVLVGYFVVERLVEGRCCCWIFCDAEVDKGRVLLLGMLWCRGW